MYKGYKVRAHIEPENIFNGWDDVDLLKVDEKGSMKKYAELVYEALKETFPGADIEAGPQNPWRTHVITPEGDLHEAGGYRGEIAEEVDQVIGEVWESEKWVVYYDIEVLAYIDAGNCEYKAGRIGDRYFFAWGNLPDEELEMLLGEAFADGKAGTGEHGAGVGILETIITEIQGCADAIAETDPELAGQIRAMAEKL